MAIIRSQYRAILFFIFLTVSFSFSLSLLPKINISKKHHWRCITIHNRWALRCQSVTRHNTCSKSNCRELRIRTSGIRITFRIEISSWQVCITLCFNFRAASGSRLVLGCVRTIFSSHLWQTAQFSWRFALGSYCSSRSHSLSQFPSPFSSGSLASWARTKSVGVYKKRNENWNTAASLNLIWYSFNEIVADLFWKYTRALSLEFDAFANAEHYAELGCPARLCPGAVSVALAPHAGGDGASGRLCVRQGAGQRVQYCEHGRIMTTAAWTTASSTRKEMCTGRRRRKRQRQSQRQRRRSESRAS